MKTQLIKLSALVIVMVAGTTCQVMAQRPERGEGPPPGGPEIEARRGGRPDGFRPPLSPILEALDTDRDHQLSAEEIANASEALKALDKNEDGALSVEELRPRLLADGGGRFGEAGPEGFGRFRGPEGEGPAGRGPEGLRAQGRRGEGFRGDGPQGRRQLRGQGREFDPDRFVERLMQFDDDENGQISSEELPEKMQRMMDRCDENEDGALTKDELLSMAKKMGERRAGGEDERQRRRPERPERPERPGAPVF